MIYVYAFCLVPDHPLALPQGIDKDGVHLITEGRLGAIAEFGLDVSEIKEDDERLMAAVLQHDHLLSQVFSQTVLLPLRFGTQFTSEASLKNYLQTHQTSYLERLASLVGKAEYLVKLAPKPLALPPLDDSLKGRDYFLAKKARQQTQTQLQTQQVEELQKFLDYLTKTGMACVHGTPHDGEERVHVLAQRDPAIAQTQMQTWQQMLPGWDVFWSEPLPPYHFAT